MHVSVYAYNICVCAGKRDRAWAHIEKAALLLGVIISRFPPKPFFHLKRLVAADWALAGSATGSGRVELFQPTTCPKSTVGEKRERERERRQQCQGARERRRERGQERERGTPEKKTFCSFPFSSLHRLHLFLSGNMDQGPKSPALRLGRAGRLGSAHLRLISLVFTIWLS